MIQIFFVYLLKCFWLMAPLGLANMAPVLCRKVPLLNRPIDGGLTFKGNRLFGKTKTWRGLFVAAIFGEIAWLLMWWFSSYTGFREYTFFNIQDLSIWLGFVLGLGALLGDLIKSFFKRRFSHESSSRWFPWDNLDYILGGIVVYLFFINLTWYDYLATLAIGLALHIIANLIGYALKIKKEPW